MSHAAITRCWTFVSSRGNRRYQTLLYSDGATSCDCAGWCKRVAEDGSRSCRHTRAVVLGTADRECESTHRNPVDTAPHATTQSTRFGQLGRRKIQT